VCRYVERNPLRARLVRRAEAWRWSSLWQQETSVPWLTAWPVVAPADWRNRVNRAETEDELAALRRSVSRGAPFGSTVWHQQTAKRLGLQSSLRNRGRPRRDNGEK
jgi:putative transposase